MTHIPGHIGTGDSGGGNLTSAIGMPLFNDQGQPVGTLVQTPSMAARQFGPLAIQTPSGGLAKFQQGFYITGTSLQPRQLFIDAQGMTTGAINVDFPTGDTGGSAPAFSSTKAAADLQFQQQQTLDRIANDMQVAEAKRQEAIARGDLPEQRRWEEQQAGLQAEWAEQTQARGFEFESGQAQLGREFQSRESQLGREFTAEQNKLAEEAALKRNRLNVLSSLISDFVGAQSQARNTLANLQPDPFQFAAVAGGVAPFGATPQQGFQQQLQQFAGAAVPQADPNASPEALQGAINQLIGARAPTPPQVFGAAGGATIPAPSPGQSVAVKVGEKGEEILRITPEGVEVIPLAGGLQTGGAIGFPFEPIQFNRESLLPALTTSGIFPTGTIPRGSMLPDQSIAGFAQGPGLPQGFLGNLGVQPSFISPFGKDEIFFRDPNNPGQFRLVTNTATSGATGMIQPGAVTQVAPSGVHGISDFGTLGSTAIGGEELLAMQAQVRERPSAFTKFSAPIFEPTTGVLLPAPFEVAQELNTLRVRNPTAFNLLLSAYKSAGVPIEGVLGGIQSSLAFGQERGAVGLR